jgi:lipopolysaccharide/colanic/teichoic acid biosynthesis glycosyltransferase
MPGSGPPLRQRHGLAARAVKRAIDIAGAAVGLIVLSPVIAAVAVLVRVRMGRPVLFRQERPGRHGHLFTVYKFRTMTDDRDDEGQLLPDEQRITRMGWFLRSTSLDELPELVNVLVGDMSLVGPRPLMVEYLDRYTPRQALRLEFRPGITGWCQVNGRNSGSWDDKLELDAWYAENWSVALDLRILASTVKAVARREGIANEGHATMPAFLGSSSSSQMSQGASAVNGGPSREKCR